jgi:hypothetical protein
MMDSLDNQRKITINIHLIDISICLLTANWKHQTFVKGPFCYSNTLDNERAFTIRLAYLQANEICFHLVLRKFMNQLTKSADGKASGVAQTKLQRRHNMETHQSELKLLKSKF